jgi:hypothetical protein
MIFDRAKKKERSRTKTLKKIRIKQPLALPRAPLSLWFFLMLRPWPERRLARPSHTCTCARPSLPVPFPSRPCASACATERGCAAGVRASRSNQAALILIFFLQSIPCCARSEQPLPFFPSIPRSLPCCARSFALNFFSSSESRYACY